MSFMSDTTVVPLTLSAVVEDRGTDEKRWKVTLMVGDSPLFSHTTNCWYDNNADYVEDMLIEFAARLR